MATKLKPSAFFARLDLSALDNISANYVKEELIGDPDIDMLEGSELMDSIIDALKENFPASLVNMPDDLKGEEPEEKPASTPEPELTVESPPAEVPPVIEEPKVPTTEERITYLETKITGFKALLSLAKTEESKTTLKKKIQGFEALINLQNVKMERGGNTDNQQLKKQKKFSIGDKVWVNDGGYIKSFAGFDLTKPATIIDCNKIKTNRGIVYFYKIELADGTHPFNEAREDKLTKVQQKEAEVFANSQAFQYADGGGANGEVTIPNNYANLSGGQIWEGWTPAQREEFVNDHKDKFKVTDFFNKKFSELDKDVQDEILKHKWAGQYAKGGFITGQKMRISADKISKGAKAYIGKAIGDGKLHVQKVLVSSRLPEDKAKDLAEKIACKLDYHLSL